MKVADAADAWGWEEGGAWPGVHVVGIVAAGQAKVRLLVRNEVSAEDLGKS